MTRDLYVISGISAAWTALCFLAGWALMRFTDPGDEDTQDTLNGPPL